MTTLQVTVTEQGGTVSVPDPGLDAIAAVVGYTSLGSLGPSVLFGNDASVIAAYGYGPAVDALCHSINRSGNPGLLCRTPGTTAGSYGVIDVTGVTGTAVAAVDASSHPYGDYEAYLICAASGLIGTAGIQLQWSLDAGRTRSSAVYLGTAATYTIPGSNVKIDFTPASADLTALNTLINEIYTDFNAHVILVGGSPVHGSTGLVDVVSIASASDTATRIARINALRTAYIAHIARTSGSPGIHITADVTAADQLAYGAATDDTTALMLALDLKAKFNLHIANLTVHTNADTTNATTSAAPSAGSLLVGDVIQVKTTAPKWADADLYDGSASPKAGAFATLGRSALDFGIVYIAGPVASGDLATITAGLDYLKSIGKRPACIAHARGPNVGESDADWLAAVALDFSGGFDPRITVCVGTAWVADPTTGRVYNRTFGPAFLGEASRLPRFQWPGAPANGALPGVSLTDVPGNLIGHDDGPGGLSQFASSDRFVALQRVPDPARRLQVFTTAPFTLFQNTDGVKHLMARRVINAMEREASSISFSDLGGTAFYDPATNLLDEATMNAIAASIRQPLRRDFANDIQNPEDDGLVVVTQAVTVSSGFVTIGVKLYPKIFGYIIRIDLTFVIS